MREADVALTEALALLLTDVQRLKDELRQIRAKLPASSINYDEEGDPPF